MKDFEKSLGFEIRELSILLGRYIDSTAKKMQIEDLRGPQAMVIHFIYGHPEQKIYQKDIEKELSIRKPSASQLLDRMEGKGYIERLVSDTDKRYRQVILTEKAVANIKQVEQLRKCVELNLTKEITKEEQASFLKIVTKMKANIQND
ncbi:MAG: MarR family winged helix-turn-helix transcriptional regulator [Enterococcus sp.]